MGQITYKAFGNQCKNIEDMTSSLMVWLDYTIIRIQIGAESDPNYSIV